MNATANGLAASSCSTRSTVWAKRIAAGETPPAPPRPQGIERNVVITQWEWGDTFTYAHDEIATDKRDPTLYPNGPIYGVDLGNDRMLSVDPSRTRRQLHRKYPTLNGYDTPWCDLTYEPLGAQRGRGAARVRFARLSGRRRASPVSKGKYPNPANPHNPMFDDQGRVWITTQVRREWGEDLPAFCKMSPPIAKNYHHRQLGWFDTRTQAVHADRHVLRHAPSAVRCRRCAVDQR